MLQSIGDQSARDLDEREYVSYVSALLEPFNLELLQWVNSTLDAGLRSKNFGENWTDGRRLQGLIAVTVPGFLPADFDHSDTQQGKSESIHIIGSLTIHIRSGSAG